MVPARVKAQTGRMSCNQRALLVGVRTRPGKGHGQPVALEKLRLLNNNDRTRQEAMAAPMVSTWKPRGCGA